MKGWWAVLALNLALALYELLPHVIWWVGPRGIASPEPLGWDLIGGLAVHMVLVPGWIVGSSAIYLRRGHHRAMLVPLLIGIVVVASETIIIMRFMLLDS